MKALLQDDNYRIPHKDGTGFLTHIDISEEKRQAVIRGDKEATQEIASEYNMDMDSLLMEAKKERERLSEENERVVRKAEGGDVDEQMSMLMGPTHTMPDGTVMPGATHGESEEPEMEMESDSEMEDNYLDFIIDEALSEEEEDMLMSKLEQDEELSMLFDKVIEVASEFAGSGPVEGPGTGVSDSIPARLSDGEFVFTAKAVEEIGADNLMAMMKDAEMKADERQGMAIGGTPMPEDEEENVVVEPTTPEIPTQVVRVERPSVGLLASAQEQEDLVGDEIKKRMMDPSTQARYVRS